jgi:hypothetical protein
MFYLKTETIQIPKHCVLKNNQDGVFLDKERTMVMSKNIIVVPAFKCVGCRMHSFIHSFKENGLEVNYCKYMLMPCLHNSGRNHNINVAHRPFEVWHNLNIWELC